MGWGGGRGEGGGIFFVYRCYHAHLSRYSVSHVCNFFSIPIVVKNVSVFLFIPFYPFYVPFCVIVIRNPFISPSISPYIIKVNQFSTLLIDGSTHLCISSLAL